MIKLLFCFVSLAVLACNNNGKTDNKTTVIHHQNEMYVEVQPFETKHGWGYNIYVDKKLYISQSIIPGVTGTNGFKTKEEAMKVGSLAVQKMSAEKRRPVITAKDLSLLHIDAN